MDVFEAAEDVDFLISEDDWFGGVRKADVLACRWERTSCPAGVFNGEFGLSVLAGDTAYGSAQMLACERLDVLDLERLNVQVV